MTEEAYAIHYYLGQPDEEFYRTIQVINSLQYYYHSCSNVSPQSSIDVLIYYIYKYITVYSDLVEAVFVEKLSSMPLN
jgi:hypothetical protein